MNVPLRRVALAAAVASCPPAALAADAEPAPGMGARAVLGVGGLGVRSSHPGGTTTGASSSGIATELSLDVGVAPRISVGGTGLSFQGLKSQSRDAAGREAPLGYQQQLLALGPSVWLHPPAAGGLTFSATLGGAWLHADRGDRDRAATSARRGFVLSLALGYEWTIARGWSVGPLVRAAGGRLWSRSEVAGRETTGADKLGVMTVGLMLVHR